MKRKNFKRTLSFVMAGILAAGSVPAVPAETKAAGRFNAETTESGYPKITTGISAEAASSQDRFSAANVVDNNVNTHWHTDYNADVVDDNGSGWIDLVLESPQSVKGMTYMPKQASSFTGGNENGAVKTAVVSVKYFGTDQYVPVELAEPIAWTYENWTGTGKNSADEREIFFKETLNNVERVRFTVTESYGAGSANQNKFIAAAEMGLFTEAVSVYTITAAAAEECAAMGTVKAPKEVVPGHEITLTAEAFPGYSFTAWKDADGNEISTAISYTFTPTANVEYYAYFEAYDTNSEGIYWDKERANNTLRIQTDADIWHYQIKTSEGWSDIPSGAFYPNMQDGSGAWLNSGGTHGTYHWAKITKDQLTPCFSGSTYQGVAYAWKASESGYAKMTIAANVRTANKADIAVTIAKGSKSEDQQVLKEVTVPHGSTDFDKNQFTTKIVKVIPGDYLRLSAATADNDLYDVQPVVVECTVREYAAQYLEEAGSKDTASCTAASAAAYEAAVNALREALDASETADAVIEEKLAALEAAIAALAEKADYTELNAAIEAAEAAIESGNYTATSVNALQVLLDEAALKMDLDVSQQSEVDNLTSRITEATVNLTEWLAVTAGLVTGNENRGTAAAAVEEVPSTKAEPGQTVVFTAQASEKYVFAGWYTDEAGTTLASTENPLSVTAETSAIARYAKFNADKAALEKAIQAVVSKQNEEGYAANYTEASRNALEEAKAAAEAVYNNEAAAAEEVEAQVQALNRALDALQFNPADYTAVNEALEAAAKLNKADYTEESWSVLEAAVAAAKAEHMQNLDIRHQAEVTALADAIYAAIDALEEKVKLYVVTVDGAEVARGEYNTPVTITAPKAPEGQKFAGWLVNGEIVSLKEVYTFAIANDVDFTAKFVPMEEAVTQQPAARISNTNKVKREDGKANIQYVGQLIVPEGYTLNEAGLIWTGKNKTNLPVMYNADGTLNTGAKKVVSPKVNVSYQFSVTVKGIPAGKTARGVIFAKVTNDKTGEVSWVFSEEISVTNK